MPDDINTPAKGLSDFELDLITFLDQQWSLTGVLLTAEQAESQFGIPVGKYEAAFRNETFKEALIERGIELRGFNGKELTAKDDWRAKSLTPTQLAVAQALMDLTDNRSQKRKLSDFGISSTQYQRWLKDPVFKDYMRERANQILGDNVHEINLALLDRIRTGDIKAIEYANEMMGIYTRRAEQNKAEAKESREKEPPKPAIDVNLLVTRIIEIVLEEVSSPDEQRAISERLRQMILARSMSTALLDEDPIVPPEVAPTRSKEPELAEGTVTKVVNELETSSQDSLSNG